MGKSPFLMGKLTISMAIFNSYVSYYQRVSGWWCNNHLEKYEFVNGWWIITKKHMVNKSHAPNHQSDMVKYDQFILVNHG